MSDRKKIVLVDDNKSFIEALKFILNFRNDIEVVGEAYDGRQFLELLYETKPDLVLLDINMPVIDGLNAARMGIKANQQMKIIGLTMSDSPDLHKEMEKTGFSGAILKSQFSDHFDNVMDAMKKGVKYFPLLFN